MPPETSGLSGVSEMCLRCRFPGVVLILSLGPWTEKAPAAKVTRLVYCLHNNLVLFSEKNVC